MVTALIAILVMLALPDYRSPITRVERVAAGVCLLEIATRLEDQRANQQEQAALALYTDESGCENALASRYLFSIHSGADGFVSAELIGEDAVGTEQCQKLVLTQQGQRGVKQPGGALDFSEQALDCW